MMIRSEPLKVAIDARLIRVAQIKAVEEMVQHAKITEAKTNEISAAKMILQQRNHFIQMLKAVCHVIDDQPLRDYFYKNFPERLIVHSIKPNEIYFDTGKEEITVDGYYYRIYISILVHRERFVQKISRQYFHPMDRNAYMDNGISFYSVKHVNIFTFLSEYQATILDLMQFFGQEEIFNAMERDIRYH